MTTHDMPAELAEILDEIIPPGSGPGAAVDRAFRHRQHIHLAFIAVRRYGTAQAAEKIGAWLRHLTAHAPQKYHATTPREGTELVGHHVTADPSVTDFGASAEQNPALLDKRLITRHYTAV